MSDPLIARTCVVVFFSSRRRHTRLQGDWSSDVCSSDLSPVRCGRPRGRPGSTQCCATRGSERRVGGRRGSRGPQIGRAAGRGRGEISGVAGSLKKKKRKEEVQM